MRRFLRPAIAHLTVFALLICLTPPLVQASPSAARLEGMLIGVDGRPAPAHRVHLIDAEGQALASAGTGADGVYSFPDLQAGSYSLGIENPDGAIAPVASAPIRVRKGELARRDLKMMGAEPGATNQALQANYGLGVWWAGLTTAAKVWTIVAIVAVVGITAAALDDDNPPETDGSPF